MKERIFTTKEQGRVLVETGLPISTAIGFRDKYLDSLHSMEDDAGRIGLIEAVTPDISDPVWDVGTLMNLLPFVSVLVETEQCYKQETSKTVGVDLGIKTLATLSDGIAVENPHFLCENQAKLKRMQRHLSRKKLGSNRRNKCRLKVSRLHRDIANKRSWYMHNLTTMLVNNYDVICIENLNASGMLQNHKLAGSVYDASFSMFRNQLEYKCRWYGKELIVIDRFYPSSKTCSRCGWKNKDLKLSDRTFVCKDCGMEIDRDLNAAINIQAVGVDAAIRTQSSRVASCVEASKME
jgi:putative transposase